MTRKGNVCSQPTREGEVEEGERWRRGMHVERRDKLSAFLQEPERVNAYRKFSYIFRLRIPYKGRGRLHVRLVETTSSSFVLGRAPNCSGILPLFLLYFLHLFLVLLSLVGLN